MIFRLLTNANYLIYFFGIFVILMLLTYLIYKLFIVENDLFIVNEKINKIELEFSNPNSNGYENLNTTINNTKENFNLTDIIMNEVFNTPSNKNKNCSANGVCSVSSCKTEEPASAIDLDIDTMIEKEIVSDKEEEEKEKKVLFDLKKEIIMDDKESIISENNTKRKLQKLNLDKLKDKCAELNLSNEGTKAQLIDRILQES